MTITATGTGRGSVTSGTATMASPTWSATPYVGSLLLMTASSVRSTATYFGYTGNIDPPGWTRFGTNLQYGQGTRSLARFYRIADGTSLDTPVVGGYSDSARTTLANVTYVLMMELQDGVIGGVCKGRWDVTNSAGYLGSVLTSLYANQAGTGTSVTETVPSTWTESAYTDAALWAVGATNATTGYSAGSGFDQAYNPITGCNQLQMFKQANAGVANSFVTNTTASSSSNIEAYVIGFTPATVRTATQQAISRLQTQPSPQTQAGNARIAASQTSPVTAQSRISNAGVFPQSAFSRISTSLTNGQSANAQIKAAGSTTWNQFGSARIQSSAAQVIASISRITTSPVLPQPATARVSNSRATSQPSLARVSTSQSLSNPANAKIDLPVWTNKILMGAGNTIDQVLSTAYFELSSDLDGGGATDLYTIVLDGGQAL